MFAIRKWYKFFALLLGLAGVLLGAHFLYANFSAPEAPQNLQDTTLGADLHDFSAEDQAEVAVQFSDFLGKPTIVYFWASWCHWCTRGMEELAVLYTQQEGPLQILAVNLPHLGRAPNELERGRAFMQAQNLPFASIYDVQGQAQAAYRVTAVPRTLFVNSYGELVYDQLGFLPLDRLENMVAGLN